MQTRSYSQMNETRLDTFENSWYNPGAGKLKRLIWFIINAAFFNSSFLPLSSIKVTLLKAFGAQVGKGCVIKPKVNIKYPWKLVIGNYCWIGENVWIDNLASVKLGSNVCISQGAMLLCGNHNFKKPTFDLMVGEITLFDGVWIGAQSIVCPNVKANSHSILSVGSVATKDLEAYAIYQGNPAKLIRKRKLEP